MDGVANVMDQTTAPPPAPAAPTWMRVLGWLGLVLHVVIAFFPYTASILLAPYWVYAVLYPVWFLLLWVAIKNLRRRPLISFVMPFVALAWWFAVLYFGDLVLGWGA